MSLTTIEIASSQLSGEPGERGAAILGRSPLRLALARMRTDPVVIIAGGMIALMALLAIFAPVISILTGHNPYNTDLINGTNQFGEPYGPGQNGFLLGTDNVGRDILVRIAYGARISLLVGTLATLLATVTGTVIGLTSGYYGGWVDAVLARLMDTVLSFPYLLVGIATASVFGPSVPLVVIIIAFFSWGTIGRIVRGQTISQKEREYVEAARSMGASDLRIMFVDILPNLLSPVIVLATLLIPTAIVFESSLSFLGVGVQPPTPSWGNMISDAQGSGLQNWWFWVFPSAALLVTTLGFNLLGELGSRRARPAHGKDLRDPAPEVTPRADPTRAARGTTRGSARGRGMTRFLIRRTLQGIFTLWVIVSLVFVLYFVAPHDPARLIAGRTVTPGLLRLIREQLGLTQPLWKQYLGFFGRLLHGNLGESYFTHQPVTKIIAQAVPVDISLAAGAGVIWLTLGLSVGILAARRPRSVWDRSATIFVLTGISFPTFILGLLLLYLLFFILTTHGISLFPGPGSYTPFTRNPLEWAHDLILPWITLALITAATYARLSRSSLLETLGEDYVRTARAKGLSERRVVYRHALRSALTPILTQFGVDLATLLGGAILTESVFGLPGLGYAVVYAIGVQDLPVIQGVVLVAAGFIVFANIVVDALYAVLDPRVRLT